MVLAPGFERDDVLAKLASAETRSEHPIAQAIVAAATHAGLNVPLPDEVQTLPGMGVDARVENARVVIGTPAFLREHGVSTVPMDARAAELGARGHSGFFAAIDGQLAALVAVADPIKASSAAAIAALKARGRDVVMITGDAQHTADAIAHEAGIDRVLARVLPGGKQAAIQELQEGGRRVAFVGDGINDAPALAAADIGIAIGTGTDVAVEAADVVLMSGDLTGVVNATEVSRRTMQNIRQNLAWAFGYNIALIPVAMGALYPVFGLLLSPMFAAGAMALSSVSVLANALRLRRIGAADLQRVPLRQNASGTATLVGQEAS